MYTCINGEFIRAATYVTLHHIEMVFVIYNLQ